MLATVKVQLDSSHAKQEEEEEQYSVSPTTDSPTQQYWRKAVVMCKRGYHEGMTFWALLEYRQIIPGWEEGGLTFHSGEHIGDPVQSCLFNPNRHLTDLSVQDAY